MFNFDFTLTFQHPLALNNLVEMVPTAWLSAIACPNPSFSTDLGDKSGLLVALDTLWDHMAHNGMRDPFIITAGAFNRTCRLEAGNHRIKLFEAHGVTHVPAVALIGESCIYNIGNGTHAYCRDLLIPPITQSLTPYPEWRYDAPSRVFKDLPQVLPHSEETGGLAKYFLTQWGPYFWQDVVHSSVMHLLEQASIEQQPGVFVFSDGSRLIVDSCSCSVASA